MLNRLQSQRERARKARSNKGDNMRELVKRVFNDENQTNYYVEIAGDSTETKPTTGIVAGSIFTETDTGAVFFFDEASGDWVQQFSFQ